MRELESKIKRHLFPDTLYGAYTVQCKQNSMLWYSKILNSPETETVASDSGINTGKCVMANSSPSSVIKDFQTSLVWRGTANQPHCQHVHKQSRVSDFMHQVADACTCRYVT